MHRLSTYLLGLVLWAPLACSPPDKEPAPPPVAPAESTYPKTEELDLDALRAALPKDENGNAILLQLPDGFALTIKPEAEREPPGPISAAQHCGEMIMSCRIATHEPDRCVADVPRCTTDTPWLEAQDCCPEACVRFYQEERRLGARITEAFSAVFTSTHECFPGYQEAVRRPGGGSFTLAPRRQPLPANAP